MTHVYFRIYTHQVRVVHSVFNGGCLFVAFQVFCCPPPTSFYMLVNTLSLILFRSTKRVCVIRFLRIYYIKFVGFFNREDQRKSRLKIIFIKKKNELRVLLLL
jgi:hypothetical protein